MNVTPCTPPCGAEALRHPHRRALPAASHRRARPETQGFRAGTRRQGHQNSNAWQRTALQTPGPARSSQWSSPGSSPAWSRNDARPAAAAHHQSPPPARAAEAARGASARDMACSSHMNTRLSPRRGLGRSPQLCARPCPAGVVMAKPPSPRCCCDLVMLPARRAQLPRPFDHQLSLLAAATTLGEQQRQRAGDNQLQGDTDRNLEPGLSPATNEVAVGITNARAWTGR